jgi:hypothetical protein
MDSFFLQSTGFGASALGGAISRRYVLHGGLRRQGECAAPN